jgi:ligand-binding sensor domain-containing protein
MFKLNRNLQKANKVLFITVLFISISGFSLKNLNSRVMQEEKYDNQIANEKNFGVLGSVDNIRDIKKEAGDMPVYGNWKTFTKNDGLPANKAYCVRIDGDRVLVGTSGGLGVYENGEWSTYTKEDGLGHNGVLAIDVSKLTGDVWLATLGGLTRWSGGRFDTFTQLNSGLANDVIYSVICDGKDVWAATGGGAGHYNTFTDEWEIYMERNAPMHEPWTYGVCAGDDKIWIAAWGGGVIEYNTKTKKFRDYIDPDSQMELDVFPDDGIVHDITTGVSYDEGILWVATYFGVNRYDGAHWNTYFDKDSGLLSDFNNFCRAVGPVIYFCTDEGLSSFNGKTWVSYQRNENNTAGKIFVTNGPKTTRGAKKTEFSASTSICHNFTIGVDVQNDEIWVATSHGVSRGERIK